MGSAATKDINNNNNNNLNDTVTTPVSKDKGYAPRHGILALNHSLQEDPRSPGSRRTPLATPNESPCVTPTMARVQGRRVVTRLGSSSMFGALDPRSPASRRTPLRTNNETKANPPAFSLLDPRSPMGLERTPLGVSLADSTDIVVVDDIVVATEEKMNLNVESQEVLHSEEPDHPPKYEEDKAENVQQHQHQQQETSIVVESTATKITTEIFSPSPTIVALAVSPLMGSRKRKDLARVNKPSPLKKSFSAPTTDENGYPNNTNPPSPTIVLSKPKQRQYQSGRTPLSPLSQRKMNSRHCMEVPPIKLRMDPAVLG